MSNIDKKNKFESTGFDYMNQEAEVVFVGITPENSQVKGECERLDSKEVKRENAFVGIN